jgi:hypothetical protein
MDKHGQGNTWPEQEAVDEWVQKNELEGFTHEELYDLKRSVSAYRIDIQRELRGAREEIERLRKQAVEACSERDQAICVGHAMAKRSDEFAEEIGRLKEYIAGDDILVAAEGIHSWRRHPGETEYSDNERTGGAHSRPGGGDTGGAVSRTRE